MSSYEAPAPEQHNAFDGWYHHQIHLTADASNGGGGHPHRQPPPTRAAHPQQPQLPSQPQHPMMAVANPPQPHPPRPTEAAAVPHPPPLPEGWEEMREPHSGRIYYVDHERQMTTWDRPSAGGQRNDGGANHGNGHGLYYLTNDDKGDDGEVEGEGEMATEAIPGISPVDDSYEAQHSLRTEEKGEEDDWDTKMKELRSFKEAHGHANVTTVEYAALGAFLDRQREYYRRRMETEGDTDNPLTIDRVQELEGLGFEFDLGLAAGDEGRTRLFTQKWDRTIEELKEYKKVHGHLNVRQKEGSLGRWVNNQRQFYRAKAKGQKSSLTNSRIKELEELGFVWQLKTRVPGSSSNKKAPVSKKRKLTAPTEHVKFEDMKSKKANTSSSDVSVSTEVLPDGSQVIDSKEKVTHTDGSTVETTTKETIQKRTIRAGGTRVLEVTTKVVTTKVELIVLPPLPLKTEASDATEKEEEGKGSQSTSEGDESKSPALEAPQPQVATVAVISEQTTKEPSKGTTDGKKEENPAESSSHSIKDVGEGSVTQMEV